MYMALFLPPCERTRAPIAQAHGFAPQAWENVSYALDNMNLKARNLKISTRISEKQGVFCQALV